MAITNATRLSDFAAGIGTAGAILQIDNANQRIGIGTQLPSQMLEVAGIVTATAFHGDGSNLEGITSAGLGTAISDVDGSAGAVVYYTDDLLTVSETTTINPPASASAAYTQYRDVKLDDNVDLIIETGDDFIPDVLGLGTDASDPTLSGNGVFDEVYAGIIKNKNGLGAPAFANGLTSVGVITATGGFTGNVTGDVTGNVNNSTNLILKTDGGERVRIDSTGKVGISTGNIDPSGNQLLIRGASTIGTNKGHIMLTGDGAVVGEGPQIVFSESGPGANWAGAYIGHTRQGGGSLGDLRFGTRAAAGDANTVPTERLRISSNGAFGIGGANYGTSGQVLTSQGSNAAPQWASTESGMVRLHSGSWTGSQSTLELYDGFTTDYLAYKIVFEMNNSSGDMGAQLGTASAWETGAGDYRSESFYARGGSAFTNTQDMQFIRFHDNNLRGMGELFIGNPMSTEEGKILYFQGFSSKHMTSFSGQTLLGFRGGILKKSAQMTRVRFISENNLTLVKWIVYGMK